MIIGHGDSELFSASKDVVTIKELSENLVKESINLYNALDTRVNKKRLDLIINSLLKH